MRKEVVCILGVLLASAWARAQHGPSVSASPASDPGSVQAGQPTLVTANELWQMALGQAGGYNPQPGYTPQGYMQPGYAPQGYVQPGYAPQGYVQPGYGYAPGYAGQEAYPGAMGAVPPGTTGLAPGQVTTGQVTTPAQSAPSTSRGRVIPAISNGKTPAGVRQVQSSFIPPDANFGAPVISGDTSSAVGEPVEGSAVSGAAFGRAAGTGQADFAWGSVSYILANLERGRLNTPLVTVGSANDLRAGALGQPGTAVVFGENNLGYGTRHGAKAEAGIFLDSEHVLSLEAGGFIIVPETQTSLFSSDSMGNPIIARPFFSTLTNSLAAERTSLPTLFSGSTQVEIRSQFYGLEANGACHTRVAQGFDADFLGGVRFLRLDERLTISDRINPLQDNVLSYQGGANFVNAPNYLTDQDSFVTSNTFYGVNLGTRLRYQYDWFFVNAYAKVGLGINDEKVKINGSSSLVTPTGTTTVPGGILALPTNIGTYQRSVFGVVPEVGATLGIEPIRHVRLTAGYSFLYWNAVARPGAQIDPRINPSLIPSDQNFGTSNSGNRPQFSFIDQSFRVHMLNVGLELYF